MIGRSARAATAAIVGDLPAHVRGIDTSADFREVATAGVNLAIMPRVLPPVLAAAVATQVGSGVESEVVIDVCDPPASVASALDVLLADVPAGPGRGAWRQDIAELMTAFRRVTDAHDVRITLETVTSHGCRKFHADRIGLRLLCTYAGPATQWLANDDVERNLLGGRSGTRELAPPVGSIRNLPPAAVGLLKGELWPGNAGNGIVHRSPPVAGRGHRRLVLCMDADLAGLSRLGRTADA